MLTFAEKRAIQAVIIEQNKILAGTPSFTEKRAAQKAKTEALAKLGKVLVKQPSIGPEEREGWTHSIEENTGYSQWVKDYGDGVSAAIIQIADRSFTSSAADANSPSNSFRTIDEAISETDKSIARRLENHLSTDQTTIDNSNFGLQASGIKTREKINAQVTAITDQIRAGRDPKTLTADEVALLKQYSGKGGLTVNSQHEYYTPTPVAEGVWDALKINGFENGNVLEPSCFIPGTLVVTDSGRKPIDEVCLDEKVFCHDGQWHKVIDTITKSVSENLTALSVAAFPFPLVATKDHELYGVLVERCTASKDRPCHIQDGGLCKALRRNGAKNGNYRCGEPWRSYVPEWVESSKYGNGDYLTEVFDARVVDVGEITLCEEKTPNISGPSVILCDEIMMRAIGIYLAEGSMDSNTVVFTFREDERDMLDALECAFGRYGWKVNKKYKQNNKACDFRIHSRSLVKFFEQFGRGAANKHIPHWCKLLPNEKQAAMLWGIWRGDGSMKKDGFTVVDTVSMSLVMDVKDVLYRFGIVPSLTKHKASIGLFRGQCAPTAERLPVFRASIYGAHLEIASTIFGVRHPFIDERKFTYNMAGHVLDGKVFHKVKKATSIAYAGVVHDLTVDNAHSYTAGFCTVHNCGSGVFLATKPAGVIATGTEIDETSATVAQVLNPGDVVSNQSFEMLAVSAPDNSFDAVVGNVPFGNARGPSAHDDPEYKAEKLIERYFVQRTIDKVKPGGLICLVVPINVIGAKGKAWEKFRIAISKKAEFLGGHKLPSKTFAKQGTDVVVDVLVMRKHDADFLARVDDLPIDALKGANVVWDEFIEGRYWQGEGKRFIHGEFVPKDPTKFRDADKVIAGENFTDESLKRALAIKFDSRIDWEALDAQAPIVRNYIDGDRRTINGTDYELQNGDWVKVGYTETKIVLDSAMFGADSLDSLQALMQSEAGVLSLGWGNIEAAADTFPNMVPQYVKDALKFAKTQPDDHQWRAFRGAIIGGKIEAYLNGGENDENELAEIKEMALHEVVKYGHPRTMSGLTVAGKESARLGVFMNAVDEAGNFSDLLESGTIKQETGEYNAADPRSIITYLFEQNQDPVELSTLLSMYEGDAMLEDLGDVTKLPGLAISPEGFIYPFDQYCSGDVFPKLRAMRDAMLSEKDPRVIEQYKKQIEAIDTKRRKTPTEDITFRMRQKWFSQSQYVIEFLAANGYEYTIRFDEEIGEYTAHGKGGGLIPQIVNYLNEKPVMGGVKVTEYKDAIKALEDQFDAFMKSHPDSEDLTNEYNEKFNGYVEFSYANSDLGLTNLGGRIKPHPYQNEAIRRLSREGKGILGFDVGLGKTFSALALQAYNEQMGRAKRTCIVVPDAVLANWYHEHKAFYKDTSRMLIIGMTPKPNKDGSVQREPILDEKGQPKLVNGEPIYQDVIVKDNAETIWAKMHSVPQSNYSLVIMSHSRFGMIPVKTGTKKKYAETMMSLELMSAGDADRLMSSNNPEKLSYADAKNQDRLAQKYSDEGTKKKDAYPYFEDMGFDSVMVDEAHCFPAGTLVDGIAIESIKIGDFVNSFNHETGVVEKKLVTNVMRRPVDRLVKVVLKDGRSVVCTPDHPFFTGKQYTQAFQLDNSYRVMIRHSDSFEGEMHGELFELRGGVHSNTRADEQSSEKSRSEGLLLNGMQEDWSVGFKNKTLDSDKSQMPDLLDGVHFEREPGVEAEEWGKEQLLLLKNMCVEGDLSEGGISGGIQLKGGSREEGCSSSREDSSGGNCSVSLVQQGVRVEHVSAISAEIGKAGEVFLLESVQGEMGSESTKATGDTASESGAIEGGRGFFEHAGICEEEGENIDGERWAKGRDGHRSSSASGSENSCGRTFIANGVQGINEPSKVGGVQGVLSHRYCESNSEIGDRGRWEGSQIPEGNGERQEENRSIEWVGVDRVEVLEPASDGGFGELCPDGFVYDITVDGNHNFFAEGILVHNCFKNSFTPGKESSRIAYLPTPDPSQRAIDMSLKMDHIRDINSGRGVVLLTATPVSNSPMEVFNMLSFLISPEEFEKFGVYTPDDFVRVFADVQQIEKQKISGDFGMVDAMVGFQNLDGLRSLFHKYAIIKDAEDVKLPLPGTEEVEAKVELSDEQGAIYKDLRAEAKIASSPNKDERETVRPLFSIIRDMDRTTTDLDMFHKRITFIFKLEHREALQAALEKMPKTVQRKEYDSDKEKDVLITVPFEYDLAEKNGKLVVTMTDAGEDYMVDAMQSVSIPEDEVSHPITPKYAELLKNLTTELHAGGKQIIFIEEKTQHQKLARIIVHHLPITLENIGIINATDAAGEKLQRISDNYNAGKIKIVIANKKAEVGVNLQKGTTAIHHLTFPWVPASMQQRNGRGVRQGNTVDKVNIYYYIGKGSFDLFRLNLINKKGSWINDILRGTESNMESKGDGHLSAEDVMVLLSDNPEEAKARMEEAKAKREAAKKAKADKAMVINLNQLIEAKRKLKLLDGWKLVDKTNAEAEISKITNRLSLLAGVEGQEAEDDRDNLKRKLKIQERKLAELDAKYLAIEESAKATVKQKTVLLKAKAKSGELPFDAEAIDNSDSVLITRDGKVIKAGQVFEVENKKYDRKISSGLNLVESIDTTARTVTFKAKGGYSVNTLSINDLPNYTLTPVAMTLEDWGIINKLIKPLSFAEVIALGKPTFEKFASQITLTYGEYYIADQGDGTFTLAPCNSSKLNAAELMFKWPDSDDEALKRQVARDYLTNIAGSYSAPKAEKVLAALFGDTWAVAIEQFAETATQEDVLKAVDAGYREMINTQSSAGNEYAFIEGLGSNASYYLTNEIPFKLIKAIAGDNRQQIKAWAAEYLSGRRAWFEEEKARRKAESDAKAMEALKNSPDFKEVPADVLARLSAQGITAAYNTEQVYIKRYLKPFTLLLFQDKKGKSGLLYAAKETLKSLFGAQFATDPSIKFPGAWWYVNADKDIEKIAAIILNDKAVEIAVANKEAPEKIKVPAGKVKEGDSVAGFIVKSLGKSWAAKDYEISVVKRDSGFDIEEGDLIQYARF